MILSSTPVSRQDHRPKIAVPGAGDANIKVAKLSFGLVLVAPVSGIANVLAGWSRLFTT
jgi:hypothetical protein